MKKFIYIILCFLPFILLFLSSCSDNSKTIANVKEAAVITYNETLSYDFFAKQAAADKNDNAQKLFVLMSRSADVQNKLIVEELKRLGVKNFEPSTIVQSIDSTLSNLYKAQFSIQYDCFNLLPLFVEQAQQDNINQTANLLNQIILIKKHNVTLLDSLIRLTLDSAYTADSLSNVSFVGLDVCQKCGNITASPNQCEICM